MDEPEIDLTGKKRPKLADPNEISSSIYCYKSLKNTSKVKPAIRPLLRKSKVKEKEPYVFVGSSKNDSSSTKLPEFFDIWQEKEVKDEKEKLAQELLPKQGVKVPPNLFQKPLLLSSVQVPDPGQSYNPEKQAYTRLVKRVIRKEKKRETRDIKVKRKVDSVRRTEAEIEKDWMEEMSQGLNLEPEKAENEVEAQDESENDAEAIIIKKRTEKTKKKKKGNKKKNTPGIKAKKAPEKSIKTILKEIKEEEEKTELKRKKRDSKLVAKLRQPKRISSMKEEDKVAVSLPNEITGSLRSTRLIGSLLKERFTSIQERNLVDVPKGLAKSKAKTKNKPWVKLSVKRSYRDVQSL